MFIYGLIFVAIGNFFYVEIYHFVDRYWYIVLCSIAILTMTINIKQNNRKKELENLSTYDFKLIESCRFMLVSISDLAENLCEILHKKCFQCKNSCINRKYTHTRKYNDKERNKEILKKLQK